MNWHPFELHTHTPHSDGRHSLAEMAREAKQRGLAGLALTDHNTISGLAERVAVEEETEIVIIQGMEWTTFYGHMVTLGLKGYADWRELGPDDIHKGIERVHSQGGLVGIAHPYALGSPICTGCHWDYRISDWNDVDYIEVWHETFPSIRMHNQPSLELWEGLLDQGFQICATSGRDWHGSKVGDGPEAATFLGLPSSEQLSEAGALQAIRSGAVSISMGPLLLCQVVLAGRRYGLGETVSIRDAAEGQEAIVAVSLDLRVRPGAWTLEPQPLSIILRSNLGNMAEVKLEPDEIEATCQLSVRGLKWLRADLYGVFHGVRTKIAFTNPVYFMNEK
ncbi:CehA/McbA family metallohydrolase [Brevibacillus reuszeri]|uniref:CehA/McbA family metallohydrolase n=1 Tax=Brevibacillus reuszeri TaxID=54915 RepID=UPI00289B7FFA|nr:CehA/McbA family metallohydrolase [Brevibacillus reuszeri]